MTNWTKEKIRFELAKVGYTNLYEMDREFNIPLGSCQQATFRPHSKAEGIIASVLKRPAHQIWPTRYGRDGKRLNPQPSRNYRSRAKTRHCQKAAVELAI